MAGRYPSFITSKQRKRFYDRIDSSGDGCWVWTSAREAGGYGRAYFGAGTRRRYIAAHRLAWMLAHPNAEIASKDYVCHHCDNPPCCRPEHLYLGTAMTNSRDMFARGRNRWGARKPQPDDDIDTVFGP